MTPILPDLSALPGLTRTARHSLSAAGITTLDQIAAMPPDELMQFKGIKTSAHAIHAGARAYVENQPVRYAPLPAVCRCAGVMFDLETDPASGAPWSWGWVDTTGAPHTLIVAPLEFAAPNARAIALPDGRTVHLAPGIDAAWRAFADAVDADCPIYHWTSFDAGVLRATAPYDVRARLDARMHDLHHSFKRSARLPVRSYSLKVVAAYFGFAWAEYDSWWLAWGDYRAWLRTQDAAALARACNYQQADVEGLAVVWKWLTDAP